MNYRFVAIVICDMCGSDSSRHKIMGMRLNRSQGRSPKARCGIAVSVKKCRNCGLVFADPQPIPRQIGDHYDVPPSNYWKPQYFRVSDDHLNRALEVAKRLLAFEPQMRALDIGAGIGKSMIAMERAGFDVEGLEPSPQFRDMAIDCMSIDPQKLHLKSMETAEFPNGSFDLINFGAVLEHLYSPAQAIEKAIPWLRPSGIIHIEVPSSSHLVGKIINTYFRLRGVNYVTNLSPMHPPYHLYEFGLNSFKEHSKRAGYEIAYHEYNVCTIYHLPKFVHPALRWYMGKTDTGMQLSVWLKAGN
jgi:SAM-dependent methyltransferase